MKQSGFDTIIRGAVERDEIVYAGFSAAAVIAFDTLEGVELVDNPNDVPSSYDEGIFWKASGSSHSRTSAAPRIDNNCA